MLNVKYIESSIFLSSPEEQTLMLFSGLVRFIMQAQQAIEGKDMSKTHDCIVKAKKILINFVNTLDMKYEVSKSLLPMYEYMIQRLTEANIHKDGTILEEILGFAKEMRDTWSQAMKISKCQG
jgi:flagellar protein FliS